MIQIIKIGKTDKIENRKLLYICMHYDLVRIKKNSLFFHWFKKGFQQKL